MLGAIVDTCMRGAAAASDDATCDDVDDDCDGHVDEDVAPMPSTCAMGACSAMGVIACVRGMLVDSCAPATVTSPDTTCDNVNDDCDGATDEAYVATSSNCGQGACERAGLLTCVSGSVVDSCAAGTPAESDASCDDVDDDCDGRVDEQYAPTATACGTGVCASVGTQTCAAGAVSDSCVPKAPTSSTDDATTPGNGQDDDCDGAVDEDVPACDTSSQTFEAGTYNLTVPGNCHSVTVRLWGAGGGAGQTAGISSSAGSGGPGGYATATNLITGQLTLYVGAAAATSCSGSGAVPGTALTTYNGGIGGTGAGANGNDGAISGGGQGSTGGAFSGAQDGGDGYFGGGGGGEADTILGGGDGGGGGAATLLIVNGVRAAVAGGGGGGGGSAGMAHDGNGTAGGSGCGGAGQSAALGNNLGGGGGGGGMCLGSATQKGSGTQPAFSGDVPSGRARGGAASCGSGGAGYAIVTFSP